MTEQLPLFETDDASAQPLTAERLRRLIHYDPETGFFTAREHRSHKKPVGHKHADGYNKIKIGYRTYRAARLAFLYMTGQQPGMVDHINRDRSDDRWNNLREVTPRENHHNTTNQSPYGVGVYRQPKRHGFSSRIKYRRVEIHLGSYATAAEASAAYKAAFDYAERNTTAEINSDDLRHIARQAAAALRAAPTAR